MKIIENEKLELSEIQLRMIRSGWGPEVVEDVEVRKITYLSDGLKVKGYLAFPKEKKGHYPCVIWCRGGIENRGSIDSFNAQGIFGQLASWGFVVFASQYRGNAGGEGQDEFGGDDVNDVLNLKLLAKEFSFADNSRWAIEGWSRGGMMTYLALTRDHSFKAAIVTGGIADLRCSASESEFMKRLFQVTLGKYGSSGFDERCRSRSIVNFADKLPKNTPLLLIHGTADDRVLPHDSIDLSYKLLENKIPFRLVLLENGDHFLKNHRKEVDRLRKLWYEKFLKD